MPLLPNELARLENDRMLLRSGPASLSWMFDNLAAADGHTLKVRFACGVRALDEAAESQALRDALMLQRPAITFDDVARHFSPTLRNAAVSVADDKGVEVWLGAGEKEAFLEPLHAAADRLAFACGLEILGPFQVDLESPSYEQKRLKDLQRTLSEQEAAGQVEHFNRAKELLEQFESLHAKAPELSPGTILSRLSPVDQGATLQTLLLASGKQRSPQSLWAVAGEYLVRVDLADGKPRTELFPLPPSVGPLRSVQAATMEGERVLLVGARSGFCLVRPNDIGNVEIYPDRGMTSQLGFSRVVFQNRQRGFVACHGEAGIVRWSYAHADGPSEVLRPDRFGVVAAASVGSAASPPLSNASFQGSVVIPNRTPGPRNLVVLDDRRLMLSVGGHLWILDGDDAKQVPSASAAEVVAILPDQRLVHVVHEDGVIATVDAPSGQVVATRRRPMRVRSAGALPWLGSNRILLAGDDGAVQCIGINDSLATEYVSNHRGLRVIIGAADLVVGVSADRQRMIFWQAWDGRAPVAELYLTAQIRHRIADVQFA